MHILKEMMTNSQVSLSCEKSCLIFSQLTQFRLQGLAKLHCTAGLVRIEVPPSKNQLTFRFPILRDSESIS